MKKQLLSISSFLLFLTLTINAFAGDDIDVDKKTGLVKVNGKETFYLSAKNASIMGVSDFALENLEHKELAYLKKEEVRGWRNGHETSDLIYQMVFTKSGNQCTLTGVSALFGVIKPLAKQIAGANLVQNGEISQSEERKFIVLHNGSFFEKPAAPAPVQAPTIIVTEKPVSKPSAPASIQLKDDKVYNNSEQVGIFKVSKDGDFDVIKIYNTADALVCTARHKSNDNNDDWKLQIDDKAATILYDSSNPLEKLMKYLVEKGIL
ncbi:MAG: hypothetical protein RL065_887 [Bacteroidota bacterium]|jgi:hypothetical protein